MVSDDTEHALITLESLLEADGDLAKFRRSLAKRMRRWFLLLPGGVGLATAKACLKLCVGFPPDRSGVSSAGNGAAMRAAIIGAFYAEEPDKRVAFVEASSRITHTDQRAIDGAQLIACAAACAATGREEAFDSEASQWSPRFAATDEFPNGVSGFVLHTVPAALGVWRRNPRDLRAAVTEAVEMGGDSDTLAAIVGGIVGASTGVEGIPIEWQTGLVEWPRGIEFIRLTANGSKPTTFWPAVALRNALFLTVILVHGFRRLIP